VATTSSYTTSGMKANGLGDGVGRLLRQTDPGMSDIIVLLPKGL
jgi:hypothetical protein